MIAKISESSERPWPRLGDSLLRRVINWDNAVAFSDYFAERHALMLKGYFRAGQVFFDQCLKNKHEKHILLYPILFCYRHALEMAIKDIVGSYGHHYGVSEPELNHNLWHIWESCKAIFSQIDVEGVADSTSTVEKLVNEFQYLEDERPEAFRYPEKRDGNLIQLPNVAIDLVNLRDVMERLENFLSWADEHLGHLCSASDDIPDD